MIVISGRNVNHVYRRGLAEIVEEGELSSSRNGLVKVYPCPITTVYDRPTERVLFDATRDANPFLHLMESLWMLAGRNDAAFLTRYAKQFEQYAEKDGNVHGAYGHRWRVHFGGVDQLEVVVEKLRKNRDDRQAVISMWDPWSIPEAYYSGHGSVAEFDVGGNDLRGDWRDRPCNTHVYLRVRDVVTLYPAPIVGGDGLDGRAARDPVLDLTVLCRSNDMLWGAYGANAVHFSVLQEYLAVAIGVGVGRMYQVSNNAHLYVNDQLQRCAAAIEDAEEAFECLYANDVVKPARMVTKPEEFLRECVDFCDDVDWLWGERDKSSDAKFKNSFFEEVAWLMATAHHAWKKEGSMYAALKYVESMPSCDWQVAARDWLRRRDK